MRLRNIIWKILFRIFYFNFFSFLDELKRDYSRWNIAGWLAASTTNFKTFQEHFSNYDVTENKNQYKEETDWILEIQMENLLMATSGWSNQLVSANSINWWCYTPHTIFWNVVYPQMLINISYLINDRKETK